MGNFNKEEAERLYKLLGMDDSEDEESTDEYEFNWKKLKESVSMLRDMSLANQNKDISNLHKAKAFGLVLDMMNALEN